MVNRPAAVDPGTRGGASFTLKAPSGIRWSVLAASGLAIEVRCTGSCSIDAGLYASARNVNRFNLVARMPVRVARGLKTLTASGTATVRVRLTKKAKRRLSGARRLSLTLRVSVKGPGGAKAIKSKTVRVMR